MALCECCDADLGYAGGVVVKTEDGPPDEKPGRVCWTCAIFEDFRAVLPTVQASIEAERARRPELAGAPLAGASRAKDGPTDETT